MTFGTSSTSIGKLSYDTTNKIFSFDRPLNKDIKLSDDTTNSLSERLSDITTRLSKLGFKFAWLSTSDGYSVGHILRCGNFVEMTLQYNYDDSKEITLSKIKNLSSLTSDYAEFSSSTSTSSVMGIHFTNGYGTKLAVVKVDPQQANTSNFLTFYNDVWDNYFSQTSSSEYKDSEAVKYISMTACWSLKS